MGPYDRTDRLRRQAAPLAAAAPLAGFAAGEAPLPAQLVERLHQQLLAGRSATAALEAWCTEQGLAAPARVRAVRVQGLTLEAPATVRHALQVPADAPLHYRRVQLVCGSRVLSEADNWYVPALLTPAMNAVLEDSDEPFGRVVAALGFQRITLRDEVFWPPRGTGHAATVLELRALLQDASRQPFSYVVESYLAAVLP